MENFLEQFPRVNFIKSDILDFKTFQSYIDDSTIFYCIDNGGVVESDKNPKKYEEINITNFSKLIHVLKNFNCNLFLFSSSYVYSENVESKESIHLEPFTLYGKLRKKQEEILINSGINYVILRLSNIYGYDAFQKIGNLGAIEKFIINILSGKPITLYGNGSQRIDYLHILDLMDLLDILLKNDIKNSIFNVGTGKAITLFEIANFLKKLIDPKYDVTIEKIPSMSIPDSPIMSIQKLKESLNWTPQINIETGITSLFNILKTKA